MNIATPTLAYVLIDDRAEFDKLDRPMIDHGESNGQHVLIKNVEQEGVRVIFQHWLKFDLDKQLAARRAKMAAV